MKPIKKISHKELVEIAYKWLLKNGYCGVVIKELVTISSEIPDVIGFGSGNHSVLIECKSSRNDFLRDKHKLFRKTDSGAGLYRIYCCPVGVIKPEDLPEKWGLIHINDRKRPITIVNPLRQPINQRSNWTFNKNIVTEQAIMYSMLRRLKNAGSITEFYKQKQGSKHSKNNNLTYIDQNPPIQNKLNL